MIKRILKFIVRLIYKPLLRIFFVMPFKRTIVEWGGYVIGTVKFLLKCKIPEPLERYRRTLGVETSPARFWHGWNVWHVRNKIWGNIYCEVPKYTSSLISIEGLEPVRRAQDSSGGFILLGLHYGPTIYIYSFKWLCDLDVRVMIGPASVTSLEENPPDDSSLWDCWRRTVYNEGNYFVTDRSMLSMVKHLKGGGGIFVMSDSHKVGAGFEVVDFLGASAKFSNFSFNLSLRNNVPIFFCVMKEDGRGGYVLAFEPAGEFLSAHEGVQKYASFLEENVRKCPYLWHAAMNRYSESE